MKLTDRFRPKADSATLTQCNKLAWEMAYEALMSRVQPEVGATLLTHLVTLYPAADIRVLAVYDCTRTVSEANVRVRMPDSDLWNETVRITLPMQVTVATSYQGLYCGGPVDYTAAPELSLNAKTVDRIKAGQDDLFKSWNDYVANFEAHGRRHVPRSVEPLLFDLVDVRRKYHAQYNQIHDWPKEYKQVHGEYPTWGDLAEQFPVAGAEIRKACGLMPFA
jgi:hypothetical protein